jgi:selenocysteine-specific elongation factor
MIIGTAGHIDHGKSTLVTALTGRPMDRLVEERRREITIELNFAPLDLGGGTVAGVVDVPGHEDFVRTMVAGASGIDLALLIVAADEGLMPQTEEHLLILEQLGVARGIPVITKTDLVDPEWLELITSEVAAQLRHSSVAFDPPITVSAKTGAGLDNLRQRLAVHSGQVKHRSAADAFRLPIDRVFSLAGVGTVVTGTAWSGRVAAGDSVIVLPSELRGRIRSLESFGHSVSRSEPGARTAIGLVGVDRHALERGSVLVTDELPWRPVSALDVEIALDEAAPRPLTSRTRLRLLLGTAEVMARVLPRGPIERGGHGMARLKLESPLVARAGDRFVLRSYSPVATIGGGWVLDPQPPRRGGGWPPALASSNPAERFRSLLQRRPTGIEHAQLPLLLGLPQPAADAVARADSSARLLGDLWVARSAVEELGRRALNLLREYHRQRPTEAGMPLETLRRMLHSSDRLVEAALDDAGRAGRLRRRESSVSLAGFVAQGDGGEAELDRIVKILSDAELAPPSVAELERSTGRKDLYRILRMAAARGRVEAVERDRYYTREALDRFTGVLNDLGQAGVIIPATIRDRLGISRKYLIPLLEWADHQGITVREGDGRRLKGKA